MNRHFASADGQEVTNEIDSFCNIKLWSWSVYIYKLILLFFYKQFFHAWTTKYAKKNSEIINIDMWTILTHVMVQASYSVDRLTISVGLSLEETP